MAIARSNSIRRSAWFRSNLVDERTGDWATAGGVLSPWAIYQPKGAPYYWASLVDLGGNGHDAIDAGGATTPDWDESNGWKVDGSNHYLATNFIPANDQSQTVIVQFTNVTNQYYVFAADDVGGVFGIRPRISSYVTYLNGAAPANVAPNLTAGNLAIAGNQGYRNGIADGGALPAWGGVSTESLYIGSSTGGTAKGAMYIQALAIYESVITAGQLLTVATAMALL